MKNEGPYLKEWLKFHLMTGVEHFNLYDSNSDDETIKIMLTIYEDNNLRVLLLMMTIDGC